MGHTTPQWRDRISRWLQDVARVDASSVDLDAVAIEPALSQYGIDVPLETTTEQAGSGTEYQVMPSGWVPGYSTLAVVEFPARQNPPRVLDRSQWLLTRSPTVVGTQVVLLDHVAAASDYVRMTYTIAWPLPDLVDATVDQVPDPAFPFVCALGASYATTAIMAMAARDRMGSMPTDVVDGRDRTRNLQDAAKALSNTYQQYLGRLAESLGGTGATTNIAWGTLDINPSAASLFHSGPR